MPIIHYSRRSRRAPTYVPGTDIDQRTPKETWRKFANQKGYSYFGRNPDDGSQVYLRCNSCDGLMSVHTHVLRTAQPECTLCYLIKLAKEASAAGLQLIRPCPQDSHRAIYRAPCGHEVSRQRGRIQKIASGKAALRCEICLEERYSREAQEQGGGAAR